MQSAISSWVSGNGTDPSNARPRSWERPLQLTLKVKQCVCEIR